MARKRLEEAVERLANTVPDGQLMLATDGTMLLEGASLRLHELTTTIERVRDLAIESEYRTPEIQLIIGACDRALRYDE